MSLEKINQFTHDTLELIRAIVARHRINDERTLCKLIHASGKIHLIGMRKICINSYKEVDEELEGGSFHWQPLGLKFDTVVTSIVTIFAACIIFCSCQFLKLH